MVEMRLKYQLFAQSVSFLVYMGRESPTRDTLLQLNSRFNNTHRQVRFFECLLVANEVCTIFSDTDKRYLVYSRGLTDVNEKVSHGTPTQFASPPDIWVERLSRIYFFPGLPYYHRRADHILLW